ncbi:MAG: phytanoyl-CoA dioxygenase family protein [Candidatus Latescibacterota bacterium]|nr:phytanoyl-CoA dioxygenase family protein [Candidatus Latescibacterota bacterium]MEC8990769.1 phytanoyl-CoA dioxygenase family protein [Candidatus Latescibacterota bacterium]MEE3337760.1 phytanoyl-CoA dioxygenase family protein [Candidatus Latescibacterota bacterium]
MSMIGDRRRPLRSRLETGKPPDVTPENGPFEVCDGSLHIPDSIEKLTNGELEFTPLYLRVGDVLVRDPRCIHRGSPNITDIPRGVAVLGFDREGTERGSPGGERNSHGLLGDAE